MKKKMVIIGIPIILVIALMGWWYYRTQTVWVKSEPYQRGATEPAKTLVVVYSRTGNTMSAAKETAEFFDVDLLTIENYDLIILCTPTW